jgi:hypothetical protein
MIACLLNLSEVIRDENSPASSCIRRARNAKVPVDDVSGLCYKALSDILHMHLQICLFTGAGRYEMAGVLSVSRERALNGWNFPAYIPEIGWRNHWAYAVLLA